jgi:deoxycytidine triphosphate deaminase
MNLPGGILSDQDILKEIQNQNIFLQPFQEKQLSNCSYDVTLGPNYFRAKKVFDRPLCPWDYECVKSYWGEPLVADTVTEDTSQEYRLPIGSQIILIEPGELILAHTNEYIGGLNHITTMMKTRSSMGRIGISVCKDSDFGDVNFYSRWTMEISNFSKATIPLVVNSRIAQIVFFYTGVTKNVYSGMYQRKQGNPEEVMNDWNVNDMLPKFRF